MSSTPPRLLAVVLESMEPDLLEQWCREGHLPTIDALRKRGTWVRLASPSYISSGCAWPTLNVGTNPAKHGIGFFHREIDNGSYHIVKKYADRVRGEPFWNLLCRAGKRVAIADLATTRPDPAVNGVMLVDWGSEHPSWKTSSQPPGLIDDIQQRFGPHPLVDWYQQPLHTAAECRDIADKLVAGAGLRTRVMKYLIAGDDYDLVFCNYSEPHWAGHMFWHLHEPRHPDYNAELAAQTGDIMLEVYRACDVALAELIKACPDANVMVLSNIGMGSHTGGDMMVAEILERLGMSGPPRRAKSIRNLLPGSRGPIAAIQQVERFVNPKVLRRAKHLLGERAWDILSRRLLGLGNNWADSRAFLLPGDNSSLIRINLAGREPKGKVAPGAEYDRLCAELIEAFSELVDPATGQRAVHEVVKIRERLSGEAIDQLPDLAVVWADTPVPITALQSPRIGRVELSEYNKRPGGHRHEGFLIAAGPQFAAGRALPTADLTDFAPTVLELFGLPLPDYLDGKPITGAFRCAEAVLADT